MWADGLLTGLVVASALFAVGCQCYVLHLRRKTERFIRRTTHLIDLLRQQQQEGQEITDYLFSRADEETQRLGVLRLRRLVAEREAQDHADAVAMQQGRL